MEKAPSMTVEDHLKEGEKQENPTDLITHTHGIWTYWTMKTKPFNFYELGEETVSGFCFFCRLMTEIYKFAPGLLIVFILSKLWNGIEAAVLMRLSSDILRVIEVGQREVAIDTTAVGKAFLARLSCLLFVALCERLTKPLVDTFRARVKGHYEFFLMKARMRLDLPTSEDPVSNTKLSAYDAWSAFDSIVRFFCSIVTSASHLGLLVQASRSSGGPFFAILCIIKPVLRTITANPQMWSQELLAGIQNPHYLRMLALKSVAGDDYKIDTITGNLESYITKEYEAARQDLGDTNTEDFWEHNKRRSISFEMFCALLEDLPLFYCVVRAVANPSAFSMASIAILQRSSTTLGWSMNDIFETGKSFQRHVSKLKNLYALGEVENTIKDGAVSYPRQDGTSEDGMRIELRGVNFKYGNSSKTNALDDVSVTFEPGQLVVIEGELFIDGLPSREYKSIQLRQSMAVFSQDHHLFPLPLRENIALGDPENIGDNDRILKAAEKGGAADFLDRLQDGIDTVLNPLDRVWSINLPSDPGHPLLKQKEQLKKKLELSGGERQRAVASRTFMHLDSGKVRFVAVDEPSSALDPEAEQRLFERLLKERKGKTMVFVTHRFGHLTKHADLIICMKKGAVIEHGTHTSLMEGGGEYKKLYDIQADAFSVTKEG